MAKSPRRDKGVRRFPRSRQGGATALHETTPLLPLTIPDLPDLPTHIETMSAPISPAANTKQRRSSLLGASRKVVTSAVRLPLRAVGRAVSNSRKDRPRNGDDMIMVDDDDDDMGQEVILHDRNGYGSVGGDVEYASISGRQSPNHRITTSRRDSYSRRNDPDWPVHTMEQAMRTFLLMIGAYMLGCKRPEWIDLAARVTEYVLTAWITCVVILFLAYIQRNFPDWVPVSRRTGEEHIVVLAERDRLPATPRLSPKLVPLNDQTHQPTKPSLKVEKRSRSSSADEPLMSTGPRPDPFHLSQSKLSHPALSSLYILDANTGERIYANTATPTHISTEWFEMDMMVLIRTPDVDDPKDSKGLPCNKQWVDYLRGKQRRFEFQYQIKLKKIPKNKAVYFSCELDEPIKMGVIQRAFVGAAMAFMKSTNPTFHYSITGSKERTSDGKYERPHMSFTVEGSLDRLVISKPGETPPKLGTSIEEDPESMKRRKKGVPVDWNLQDTYTMALWSAYVDFLDWRVINLPGIRPFGLSSILGMQPFYLTMYMIDESRANEKHYMKDITNVINLELSNDKEAEKGAHASRWFNENEGKVLLPLQRLRSLDDAKKLAAPESTNDLSGQEILASRSAEDHAEEVEDDDDAETAAELGEGIYMRSGDSMCLRELVGNGEEENNKGSFVSMGGGFAVLQEQNVPIIIETTRRSEKNRLIKSGDTVMFKMVQGTKKETKYLTIHRGWWLKWVSTVPSKNGSFTIYNHDYDFEKCDHIGAQTSDSQSSYLTMGGSFTLRHKRWSSYFVGVASEPSPTYGGRMLGLYNPKKTEQTVEEQYQSDEGEADEGDPDLKASKANWMKPLILTAIEPQSVLAPLVPVSPKNDQLAERDDKLLDTTALLTAKRLTFCSDHARADVPAWIEMMNRRDRVRQLTYVVRVSQRVKEDQKSEDGYHDDMEHLDKEPETFFRLRTGRELAEIMRVGQSVRHYVSSDDISPNRSRRSETWIPRIDKPGSLQGRPSLRNDVGNAVLGSPIAPKHEQGSLLSLSPRRDRKAEVDLPEPFSFDSLPLKDEESDDESADDVMESDDQIVQPVLEEGANETEDVDLDSDSESDMSINNEPEVEVETDGASDGERKKKQGVVGKSKALIGKSVKATAGGVKKTAKLGVKTTKLTGKVALATGKLTATAVKGAGKLTGKAAVGTTKVAFRGGMKAVNAGKSAGRAVIAPVSRKSKKPPKTEPKTKHKEKDQVAVSRSLKKIARIEKKSASFLAGELCAPEQSRRTASGVLSRMSTLPMNAPHWKQCNSVLQAQVQHETEQDRWFLEGTSVEIGVIPLSGENSRGKILHESLVARCLWESHWREEWCGVYGTCVSFYAPLSKTPCIEIAFIDITAVRPLDTSAMSPLPGLPLLVLETAWLCHYFAFHDEVSRDTFGEKVETAIDNHIKQVEDTASLQEEDLRKARFWQGFQSLSESSLSSGVGKWAKLSIKDKLKDRAILNGRRMAFDPIDVRIVDSTDGFAFVEDLLARALSFSLESLENNPDSFVEFLDLTSQLRILPLDEIDLSSRKSLCFFANIYHCLLQQAMLLSVNGPLHKKSVNQFMRTACYEIGGDVFSLAELYCCVLRGKLSKPINPKPPYIEAPKKSQAYRHYALDCKDPRLNFVLNTGDVACPRDTPILRPSMVEQQLNVAASIFLRQELEIDPKKSVIILPKICEVFKNDFGGDAISCLKFCMGGLDEGTASTIRVMMMDMNNLMIRYQQASDQYHTSLTLRDEEIMGSNDS